MEGDEPASMHPSFLRAYQLELNPIRGRFDADHLRRIHGHIFQDFPEFSPGVFRESKPEFPHYMKNRKLEAGVTPHRVHYMPHGFAARVDQVLGELGGVEGHLKRPGGMRANRLFMEAPDQNARAELGGDDLAQAPGRVSSVCAEVHVGVPAGDGGGVAHGHGSLRMGGDEPLPRHWIHS